MGRRERYIALTDAQLQQLEQAELRKQKQIENSRSRGGSAGDVS